jgi:putative copper export protein
MSKLLTIIIGFVHDLAAGCWAATVLAVWWLDRQAPALAKAADLGGLQREFFYAGVLSLVAVMVTGAGRSFTYVQDVYGVDNEHRRRQLLVIKHAVLLTVFALGTWWQYATIFE